MEFSGDFGLCQSGDGGEVLLLESRDIALMNEPTMRSAVRAAFPEGPPSAVDQIWYAETYPATAPAFYEFTARGRGFAS